MFNAKKHLFVLLPFLLWVAPFARGAVFAHCVCLGNFDYLLAASVEPLAVLCLVVAF